MSGVRLPPEVLDEVLVRLLHHSLIVSILLFVNFILVFDDVVNALFFRLRRRLLRHLVLLSLLVDLSVLVADVVYLLYRLWHLMELVGFYLNVSLVVRDGFQLF